MRTICKSISYRTIKSNVNKLAIINIIGLIPAMVTILIPIDIYYGLNLIRTTVSNKRRNSAKDNCPRPCTQ